MLLFGTLINELKNFTSLTTYLGRAEKTPICLSTWNRGVKAYTGRLEKSPTNQRTAVTSNCITTSIISLLLNTSLYNYK